MVYATSQRPTNVIPVSWAFLGNFFFAPSANNKIDSWFQIKRESCPFPCQEIAALQSRPSRSDFFFATRCRPKCFKIATLTFFSSFEDSRMSKEKLKDLIAIPWLWSSGSSKLVASFWSQPKNTHPEKDGFELGQSRRRGHQLRKEQPQVQDSNRQSSSDQPFGLQGWKSGTREKPSIYCEAVHAKLFALVKQEYTEPWSLCLKLGFLP